MRLFFQTAVAMALVGASSFAANGSNLIGVSPVSTALGGTGVGMYMNETDAIYKNPALLGDHVGAEKFDAELSTNFYSNNPSANLGGGATNSSASGQPMPNLAASWRWDYGLTFGIAAVSYGGGIVDYTGVKNLNQVKTTNYQARVMPAVSWKVNEALSLGVSPFFTYGTLATNGAFGSTTQSTRDTDKTGGFGGELGALYKISKAFVVGGAFTTKSNQAHENIFNLDLLGPKAGLAVGGPAQPLKVQSPAEIALGVGYGVTEDLKLTFDYRYIAWSSADSYRELGWQDQNVFALGAQYTMGKLAIRGGFNYAKSPIRDIAGEAGDTLSSFQGHDVFAYQLSNLNLTAFPALAQSHFTLGGGYQFTDALGVDLGFMYAPKTTITRSGSQTKDLVTGAGAYTFVATSTQWSVGAGATYKF